MNVTWQQLEIMAILARKPLDNPVLESKFLEYGANDPTDQPVYYRFLYLLAPSLSNYAELGCYRGWAILHLLTANPELQVWGIDVNPQPCPEVLACGFQPIWSSSTDPAMAAEIADESLDAVFIDSDHSYDTTAEEYRLWWPKIRPGGLCLFDDISYPEYGCTRFWQELEGDKRTFPELHPTYGFGVVRKPIVT